MLVSEKVTLALNLDVLLGVKEKYFEIEIMRKLAKEFLLVLPFH